MSATPDSTLTDPQQIITDLRHQLALRTAERDDAQRKLKERTAERDEALEQQTASAEVLQVINSSAGELEPVFDAMLDSAMSLCEASFGALFIREGERSRAVATRGIPDRLNDFVRQGFVSSPPNRNPIFRGEAIAHVLDLTKEPLADQPGRAAAVELGGARTMLGVALRRDGSVFRRKCGLSPTSRSRCCRTSLRRL